MAWKGSVTAAASAFSPKLADLSLSHQIFWKLYASRRVKRSKGIYAQNLDMMIAETVKLEPEFLKSKLYDL